MCKRFYLEQILLVTQTLFLLLPELVQAVIMPVEVHEFVVSLCAGLADLLAYIVQLFAGRNDSRIDELQLGRERFCVECQQEVLQT